MRFQVALVALIALSASAARAQSSASEHIALGDREHTAMNPTSALAEYDSALVLEPRNYEALWRAAREAVDLGEYERDKAKQGADFSRGERDARLAVQVNAGDPEGHFQLARALGRRALTLGPRDRIKYATEVRAQALDALKLDPHHPGALHVMGEWNAEVMRLNGMTRWIAKNVLGGDVFGSASWDNAVRYMEQSVAVEPTRIVHRLDLAKIYADIGEKAKAREQYEIVVRADPTEYNDRFYKAEAQRALSEMKD